MSTYICTKCGCVTNTAYGGNLWTLKSKSIKYKDELANTVPLCVECLPNEYSDGSINRQAGKWPEGVEKHHWSYYGTMWQILDKASDGRGDFVNAIEYFGLQEDGNDETKKSS